MDIELRNVRPDEFDAFFELFAVYHDELGPSDPIEPQPRPTEPYRRAFAEDPEGQRLRWILADGRRVGFLITRITPDWPEEELLVGEVVDSYVVPSHRRRGVAEAAVGSWLEELREAGVALAEANVLRDNTLGLAFWEAQGFVVRSLQTARRP